jgi:phosphoserine aminotransferase
VLEKAQSELLNYDNTGMSVMELSHRGKTFAKILAEAKANLTTLLNIPDNYEILFMQGGGTTQFSAVVYNLLAAKGKPDAPVDYCVSGSWSQKASEEAKRLGANVNIVFNSKKSTGSYTSIPPESEWKLSGADAAYVYYCDNETVHGVEFPFVPTVDPSVPLVADMSSNILSRKVDVSKFAIIYAGAQKNIGPSGVTIVIIRKDLLTPLQSATEIPAGGLVIPQMLDFKTLADNDSLYNTPPTYAIYMSGLVFKYMLENGGVDKYAEVNDRKASKLYHAIDNSKIYKAPVAPAVRSKMNVPFRIYPEPLEAEFLKGAEARNMVQLKGHRSVGKWIRENQANTWLRFSN